MTLSPRCCPPLPQKPERRRLPRARLQGFLDGGTKGQQNWHGGVRRAVSYATDIIVRDVIL